jgi:hypothetical protein
MILQIAFLPYFLITPNWAATAAAVLELGESAQSPMPKMLGYLNIIITIIITLQLEGFINKNSMKMSC